MVRPICIHDGAWVGARASLAPGVTVGACAIVGFGAVATKDIPPFEIHVGNPATLLRHREIKSRPNERE
jgi:acetyltransferase-like isoleucine patch superfamily enzyme